MLRSSCVCTQMQLPESYLREQPCAGSVVEQGPSHLGRQERLLRILRRHISKFADHAPATIHSAVRNALELPRRKGCLRNE